MSLCIGRDQIFPIRKKYSESRFHKASIYRLRCGLMACLVKSQFHELQCLYQPVSCPSSEQQGKGPLEGSFSTIEFTSSSRVRISFFLINTQLLCMQALADSELYSSPQDRFSQEGTYLSRWASHGFQLFSPGSLAGHMQHN